MTIDVKSANIGVKEATVKVVMNTESAAGTKRARNIDLDLEIVMRRRRKNTRSTDIAPHQDHIHDRVFEKEIIFNTLK